MMKNKSVARMTMERDCCRAEWFMVIQCAKLVIYFDIHNCLRKKSANVVGKRTIRSIVRDKDIILSFCHLRSPEKPHFRQNILEFRAECVHFTVHSAPNLPILWRKNIKKDHKFKRNVHFLLRFRLNLDIFSYLCIQNQDSKLC